MSLKHMAKADVNDVAVPRIVAAPRIPAAALSAGVAPFGPSLDMAPRNAIGNSPPLDFASAPTTGLTSIHVQQGTKSHFECEAQLKSSKSDWLDATLCQMPTPAESLPFTANNLERIPS